MKRKTILGVMIVAFLPLIVGDGVVDLPAHIHVDSSTEIVPPTRLLLASLTLMRFNRFDLVHQLTRHLAIPCPAVYRWSACRGLLPSALHCAQSWMCERLICSTSFTAFPASFSRLAMRFCGMIFARNGHDPLQGIHQIFFIELGSSLPCSYHPPIIPDLDVQMYNVISLQSCSNSSYDVFWISWACATIRIV